jgi:ATP-binding cassette subfamily B protein
VTGRADAPHWRSASWATVGRTARLYLKLSPRLTVFAVLGNVLLAFVPAIQVTLTARAVQAVTDAVSVTGDERLQHVADVGRLGAGIAALAVVAHLVSAVDQYVQSVLSGDLDTRISQLVMRKAASMELEQYEDASTYDILQRASRDGASRVLQLLTGFLDIFRDLLTLASMGAVLLSWNWVLAIAVVLSPIPAVAANLHYAGKQYELEYGRSTSRRRVAYLQYLTTTDHPYKEVRLFRLAPHLLEQHAGLVSRFFREDRWFARRTLLAGGALGLVSVALSAGAVVLALTSAVGTEAVGRLAGTLQAIAVVQGAATGLLMGLVRLYQSNLFAGNLFELLDLPERAIRGGARPFPSRLTHGIEFEHVSFAYPGTDRRVIDDVNLFFPAQRCTALVGLNGSGKTTLIKLLNRLYEPDEGRILVDHVPIEEYDLDSLRSAVSVLFQDFIRYEMSLRENVGFGKIEDLADDERISAAIELGGAQATVARLPAGLDTTLGRRFADGEQLSVGQWQKIALARALVAGAGVLVLDEPTASIDARAEVEIFERLREVATGATTVLIAHRFATVRMADHILVIDKGRIIEQGTHEELLALSGQYAAMFTLQAHGYRD